MAGSGISVPTERRENRRYWQDVPR
jgi:hypothetical protein